MPERRGAACLSAPAAPSISRGHSAFPSVDIAVRAWRARLLSPTLAASSVLTLATALLYASVGLGFARRAQGERSLLLFALFWFAIAYYGVTEALWSLAVPLFDPPLALGVTVLRTKLLVGAAGFLGLCAYVLRVYTGRDRLPLLAAGYAALYLFVAWSYAAARPVGQEAGAWRSGLVYANEPGLAGVLANVALFLPPLVASIAYALLYRRAEDAAQRRRILGVSLGLAAFFGGLLVGWTLDAAWWPPVERVLALAAVLAARRALGES